MAQAAGFQEQSFLTAAGPLAEGVMSRSSLRARRRQVPPGDPAVNAMFRAKANKDLNDNTSRQIVAVQVLADAIDRAGSTKPEDIRQALIKTDVPGNQTIMPWKGIKFDSTGQNTEATPVIQQIEGGVYHVTIYPFEVAVQAPVWNVGKCKALESLTPETILQVAPERPADGADLRAGRRRAEPDLRPDGHRELRAWRASDARHVRNGAAECGDRVGPVDPAAPGGAGDVRVGGSRSTAG